MALVPGGYQGGYNGGITLNDLYGWARNHPSDQNTSFVLGDTPYANQMLSLMQKYDPSASIQHAGFNPNGQALARFNFDTSKLPAEDPQHSSQQGWAAALPPEWAMGQKQSGIGSLPLYKSYNKADWYKDPNYGWLTKESNVSPYMGEKNFGTDVIGPIIAGLATGVMGGGLGSALGMGPLGSMAGRLGTNLAFQGLSSRVNDTPFKINPWSLGASALTSLLPTGPVQWGGRMIGSLASQNLQRRK